MLDEIEFANAKIHGYGSLNFGRNLRQCYEHLSERGIEGQRSQTVMSFRRAHPGMSHAGDRRGEGDAGYLAQRHDLTLFTKGHPDEQKLKIDRSGLGRFFRTRPS